MSLSDLSLAEKRKLLAEKLQEKVDVAASSPYPLSHGQSALWFLYELAPESAAYNIMHAVRLRFRVNKSALWRSFQNLIDRHSSLRTVYSLSNGKPMQRVQKHQQVPFEATDAADWSWESLNERLTSEADRPFDLERGPILRVHLFTRSAAEHILLLVVHHIAVDVWSLDILMNELRVLYDAELVGKEPLLPTANPQ